MEKMLERLKRVLVSKVTYKTEKSSSQFILIMHLQRLGRTLGLAFCFLYTNSGNLCLHRSPNMTWKPPSCRETRNPFSPSRFLETSRWLLHSLGNKVASSFYKIISTLISALSWYSLAVLNVFPVDKALMHMFKRTQENPLPAVKTESVSPSQHLPACWYYMAVLQHADLGVCSNACSPSSATSCLLKNNHWDFITLEISCNHQTWAISG